MKKLNLQLGSIKEMLTKEQMKKVAGGYGEGENSCVYDAWVAHNDDWTAISICSSEAQAQLACTQHGWAHYCHDQCLKSCCKAQPSFAGCPG